MIKNDPLRYFMSYKEAPAQPAKERPLDGLSDDIDGEADDTWHEMIKKYAPEILWNPNKRAVPQKIWGLSQKGGAGSGNFGHQGLAGVWGGSTTDTSTKRPPKTVGVGTEPDLRELSNAISQDRKDQAKALADKMHNFSGVDTETGYTIKTNRIKAFENVVTTTEEPDIQIDYQAFIYDEHGKSIGEVELTCNQHPDGTNTGYIDFIFLSKEYRKSGFGKRYIDHVENVFFDDMGVKSISLIAALDVGGYFWAKAGYDFKKESEKREAIQWLGKEWQYRYNESIPKNITDNLNHTWDIACLVGGDGFKIGKQAMLGVSWRGEKTSESIGRQIGQEYFRG